MQKKKFRIGELAKQLDVEHFVVRFWEKEFNIKTTRSPGGQRFYNKNDLTKFATIKKLLYEDGFTIAGAKKKLNEKSNKVIASQKTTIDESKKVAKSVEQERIDMLSQQIIDLKGKLRKLRELL